MLELSMHLNDSLLLVDVYLTNNTGLEFHLKIKSWVKIRQKIVIHSCKNYFSRCGYMLKRMMGDESASLYLILILHAIYCS
jgi:response regulator of citrate/malate metabolism